MFIDEVLTTIDQELYNTSIFIDYLLSKIGIFLVKTVALYRLIMYNKYIKLRRWNSETKKRKTQKRTIDNKNNR